VTICAANQLIVQRRYDGGRQGARFFGGPLQPSGFFAPWFKRIQMTATAILFTSAGFAVAADGRQRWGHAPTRDSATLAAERENEQKIFEVPGVPVAYTIRGDAASRDHSFDISAMLQTQIAEVLERNQGQSLYLFADAVSVVLQQAIERARRNGVIEDYPEAEVTFVGYMREQPGWVDVRFRRYANGLAREVIPRVFSPACWYYTGSPVIAELMASHDPRVPDIHGLQSETMSLNDGVTIARAYVETCCSPLGMEVDAENCASIGGHVHVATVCPFRHIGIWERWKRAFSGSGIGEMQDGGFQWIIPPRGESR
jgi:hypothetical protein